MLAALLSAITIAARGHARRADASSVSPLIGDSSACDALRWLGRSHWL